MNEEQKIEQDNLVARKIVEMSFIIDDWKKITYTPLKKQARQGILEKARELIAAADEGEPQISETSCNCAEDYFDDEDDGVAHATLRTAQIKSIDFSKDGVTTINMRNGDPIIFKDISEVMFIS